MSQTAMIKKTKTNPRNRGLVFWLLSIVSKSIGYKLVPLAAKVCPTLGCEFSKVGNFADNNGDSAKVGKTQAFNVTKGYEDKETYIRKKKEMRTYYRESRRYKEKGNDELSEDKFLAYRKLKTEFELKGYEVIEEAKWKSKFKAKTAISNKGTIAVSLHPPG